MIFKKTEKIGRIPIHYVDVGSGPVLVLIHGWTNNWRGFLPMIKQLKDSFRLIVIDLPGFGDSGRLPCYSLDIQSKYLHLFFKKLNIIPNAVVGHSMGAHVTSYFSKKYPKDSQNYILIAPVFNKILHPKLNHLEQSFFQLIKKNKYTSRLAKKTIDHELFAYFAAKYINMYRYNSRIIKLYGTEGRRKMSVEAYLDMGISLTSSDLYGLLKSSHQHYLVIYGDHDKFTSVNQFSKLFSSNSNFTLVTIPKAGHIVTVEKPVEVSRAIKNYLLPIK